jgi:hypothetical protein
MLLRTMPEPSTTEGRRIQGELKDLLEDAAVRRAESSASRRRGCPSEHYACGRRRSAPSAHGTGRLQPRTASAANNTAATVEPASRKGCAKATTPGAGGAMTVRRIGAPRPNHQVHESLAEPYDGRRSRPGSEPRLPSPSTQGRQGRSCGLRITGWRASWEGRMTTTSSSATSPFSSPTLPRPGWSICLLHRSPTGTT